MINDRIDLGKLLRGFWEIENFESELIKTKETIKCEEHFLQNHTRDETGKYIVVKMSLEKDPACLDRSRDIVVTRLSSQKELKVDSDNLKLYKYFLTEYSKMDHITEIIHNEEKGAYFKSYLGLYYAHNNTTPLKVLFMSFVQRPTEFH